jgi:hypothetical protein
MICYTLEKDFSNFFENFIESKQSDNYNNFDNIDNIDNIYNIDNSIKSKIKIKLNNGIILPHEANEYSFDKYAYIDKYKRRIDRFNDIVRNNKIKKIFIRSDNKKITDKDKQQLEYGLKQYGCINYHIIFIDYSDFQIKGDFNWKREYIDFKKLYED